MDVRWGTGNVDRARIYAKELVDLQPDVILAHTTPMTAALQEETRTIPIVFVNVADPIGSGFVESLPRPGGNMRNGGSIPNFQRDLPKLAQNPRHRRIDVAQKRPDLENSDAVTPAAASVICKRHYRCGDEIFT
jgi:ABC transporter substrate binding protein